MYLCTPTPSAIAVIGCNCSPCHHRFPLLLEAVAAAFVAVAVCCHQQIKMETPKNECSYSFSEVVGGHGWVVVVVDDDEVDITNVTGHSPGNPEPMPRVRVHAGFTNSNPDPYPSVPYL